MQVGDCLKVGGTPDRSEATKVQCGSRDSNFNVAAAVENSDQCPVLLDVDSYYSMRSAFSDTGTTVCMDIDWGGRRLHECQPRERQGPLPGGLP